MDIVRNLLKKNFFKLTFQDKLLLAYHVSLFPEDKNKNIEDFIVMILEILIEKTENMTNKEIDKFFE